MKTPNLKKWVEEIELYAQLKSEFGTKGISSTLIPAEKALRSTLSRLKKLPIDPKQARLEPNDLRKIRLLRPPGPRRLREKWNPEVYSDRLEGALLGRMAGCTLGVPVESWPIEKMKALAEENGDSFPPTDYWSAVPEPAAVRNGVSRNDAYTRSKLDGVPVDDDIAYTLLGLLIAEQYGHQFSTEQVGKAWIHYLPVACTAEHVALENLKQGVPASKAGARNNPYCQWIGAAIRADPWGYIAPGWPEYAADMAYRDASISHRRQGIYGEMFFAAAIAAAFTVNDPVEALQIGLTEIPRDCALAKAIRWALETAPKIKNYRQARAAVDERFEGMHPVHTVNNACLTIWGVTIGKTDFTKVIGETVAMGMDNDCTAATAGSIVGAVIGKKHIPPQWHEGFNNTVHSYLNGRRRFSIQGLVQRFTRQAKEVWNQ